MKITEAKYANGWLMLAVRDHVKARQLVYHFKAGDYELTKAKTRRSLSANAYCWSLCREIAAAVGLTKEEIYREAVRRVGPYAQLVMPARAAEDFTRRWRANGTGWNVDLVDKAPDGILLHAYYGSSTYDTREMSRLLDYLVQDAKALGIETLSERELSLLTEEV